MKNNFAKYLTSFFLDYLSGERGVSTHTIRSYSNTFTLLLNYLDEVKHIKVDKLVFDHITRKVVLDFLDWLQNNRNCGNTTRNQRLAALHAFFKYMQYEDVQHLQQWQDILSIKIRKAGKRTAINYLTIDGIKLLLEQVPTITRQGRRDLAMIALLYDSGARVQELIDLTPMSLNLNNPCYVTLFGKGNKKRIVPLQDRQVSLLQSYMKENGLDKPSYNQRPLFANNRGGKLTNAGVTFILKQYANNAHKLNIELIPDRISPHSLRHSKAMHLLQAGVNLIYIRDILGHVSIQTTEVYARADSKLKREALEAVYINIIPVAADEGSWEKDSQLKLWLKGLGK
ncbi:MAG: site-specific integrase [Chitinophagaceae bacterium]